MADKQATVYVVDLGASTGECHNGRVESDLEFGMRYVWEKIAQTLSANRAGLLVGVVGFRTDQTDHMLDLNEYTNIWTMKPLESIKMGHLKELQRNIRPSHTDEGDAISAVVVAIQMIEKATTLKSGKPGKYKRTIVLLTNGEGHMDSDGLDDIASKIKEVEIELKVIGVDFDDPEYGFKEEDKSQIKKYNESILQDLVEKCDGTYGTAAAAIDYLSTPEVKTTRPYKTYTGKLCLGDWQKYEQTALYIDVIRYFKTKQRKPESASSFVSRPTNGATSGQSSNTLAEDVEMEDAPPSGGDLAAVKNSRSYNVKTTEGVNKTVERDELAKGYEYGRTAVPISESDENVTKLETFADFTIIGFIPWDKYERYLNMGESCITVAEATNDKARMALSSLIRSLHELESYAVARFVPKDGKDPQVILLAPMIEPDIEALIDVPLPFAEDVRLYRFPPLDRVITTSGATVQTHRNLPSDDLIDAMSNYVDGMDLSKFGKDEDGDPTEYLPIEETYSPVYHRINQAIRRRATHPDEQLADPADILTKFSHPPPELVSKTAPELNALIEAADVKKVPPRVKGKRNREAIVPLSGLEIDKLLKGRDKISKDNAISEFKQMLANADGSDNAGLLRDAAKQMDNIIRELIQERLDRSNGGKLMDDRVVENIRVMRNEMIDYEDPKSYNNFIRALKKDMLNGSLGEDRRDLWLKIKWAKLGLIDNEVEEKSDVSVAEAAEFLNSKRVDLPTRNR